MMDARNSRGTLGERLGVIRSISPLDMKIRRLRDDPLDREDALFICGRAGFGQKKLRSLFAEARIPDVPEIREQFEIATTRLIDALG